MQHARLRAALQELSGKDVINRNEKQSCCFEGEGDSLPNLKKKKSLLWKRFVFLPQTRTTASGLNCNSGKMKHACSKAPADADTAT